MKNCSLCGEIGKLQHGWSNRQKPSRREAFVNYGAKTEIVIQMSFESIEDVDKYTIQLWESRYDK